MTNDIFSRYNTSQMFRDFHTMLLTRIHNPISNLVKINLVEQINRTRGKSDYKNWDSTSRSSIICQTDTTTLYNHQSIHDYSNKTSRWRFQDKSVVNTCASRFVLQSSLQQSSNQTIQK